MTLSDELAPVVGAADSPVIVAQLTSLPMERRIGQMLMLAFPGPSLPDYLTTMIEESGIGAVLLFSDNLQSPWQSQALTGSLYDLTSGRGLPLPLIAIDQEGGAVSRTTIQ